MVHTIYIFVVMDCNLFEMNITNEKKHTV